MDEVCVILTTTDSEAEADGIARSLVEVRLAACVQRWPIESVYRWKGAVEQAGEFALLIKTTVDRAVAVETWIGRHHSYEVAEVMMIPVPRVAEAYRAWVEASTRDADGQGDRPG
jgi:periplasmic divalent cation tolerance protein